MRMHLWDMTEYPSDDTTQTTKDLSQDATGTTAEDVPK
jgi:hypothetical protein